MTISSEDKCWIDLAAAIIEQAMTDYEFECCNGKRRSEQRDTAREIRKFFLSKWGQLLSFGNGAEILRRCDENVENKKKPARRRARK